MSSGKILVILDLDETLIHATVNPRDDNWTHEVFKYKVYLRPYLSDFLQSLTDDFEVAVWSSASDDYVQQITSLIFPENYPLLFVWGRSRCVYSPDYKKAEEMGYFDPYNHYEYIKPIAKLKGRFPVHRNKILIIDDTPRKSSRNYGNAIYPKEFNGDMTDNELLMLSEYLKTLKDLDNVRSVEKRFWRDRV